MCFALNGADPAETLVLVVANASGTSIEIPAVAGAAGVEASLDLADFLITEPAQWTVHIASGPLKIAWVDVPWDVPELEPWDAGDGVVVPSVRPDASATFVIDSRPAEPQAPRVQTIRLSSTRNGLRIRADAWVPPHRLERFEVSLVGRHSRRSHRFAVEAVPRSSPAGPASHYRIGAYVRWSDLPADIDDEFLDVYVVAVSPTVGEAAARLSAPNAFIHQFARLRTGSVTRTESAAFYDPRYTFKSRFLTVHVAPLAPDAMRELTRLAPTARVRRLIYTRRNKPLWLVGELPYKAQDTGFAFFAYLRSQHPEIDARYVVATDSADVDRVAAIGPVVAHGSAEHVRLTLMASRVIGSHHADYVFPARVPPVRRKVGALLVFLQHGVMGTKWMANLYGRGLSGFSTDLFVVSSPRERDLVIRDFHYRPDQVAVTGLSRFDALMDEAPPRNQVVVIPTWRDWITSKDEFAASEFRECWQNLLADPRFADALAGNDVVVILHPNFRQYAPDFEVSGARLVAQGEVPVQQLLKESKALITDYSSVGFDFALQHRPVVYFQFDRSRFLGPRGSHLDLDEDLPGDVTMSHEGAIEALQELVARDFTQLSVHAEVADTYFPMRDRESNARIFAAIATAKRTRPSAAARRVRGLAAMVGRTVRTSGAYVPTMRALLAITRLLPLREDLVVFENNLGRGYGDSPKAIYHALTAMRPDLHVVWASHVPIADATSGTEVVPRLSWRYFWYLGRAKYWVNNQSFPHYVHRRRRQVFVQTWHGTPLKRMLFDVENITGRDSGYLKRASTAAAQWSHLTSPNPYATRNMAAAFRHHATALELGYPRNDIFYGPRAERVATRVRKQLGVPRERALVLFAPTFRDRGLNAELVEGPTGALDFEAFARELGDRATLVIRRHVLDTHPATIPAEFSHCVVDASGMPDAQELLVAADVLVTDYSSLFFDFLNTRRPCVFFAPDLEDYRDNVRGFYLDYDSDLPGPIATDVPGALAAIGAAIDDGGFAEFDLEAFASRYCPMDDGHAAARVVDAAFGDHSS